MDNEFDEARTIARSQEWTPERVLADLDHVDLFDRKYGEALHRHRDEILPRLRGAMALRSGSAKINASRMLLELGEQTGTNGLIDCVNGRDGIVRENAMRALCHLPWHRDKGGFQVPLDKDAVFAAIDPLLGSNDPRLSDLALGILERLGTEEANRRVAGLIDHPRKKVRHSVACWLAYRGEDGGSVAVIDALLRADGDRSDGSQ